MKGLSNVRNVGVDRKGRSVRESVKEQNKEGEESQVIYEISDNSSFNYTTMGMPVTYCTTLVGDSKSAHGLSQNVTLAEMFSRLEQRLENKFEQFANTLESIKQSIETGSDRKAETERFEVSHTNINEINGKVENHITHSNGQVSGIMTQMAQCSERIGSIKSYDEDSYGSLYQDIDKNVNEIGNDKDKIQRHGNIFENLSRSTTALQTEVTKVHETVQLLEQRMMVMGQGRSGCTSHSIWLSGVPENKLLKFNGDRDNNPALFIKSLDDYFRLNEVLETEKLRFIPHVMTGDAYIWWLVISPSIKNYTSFKSQFLDKYWDRRSQRTLYDKLLGGSYDAYRSNKPREEYATRLFAEASEVRMSLSEGEIVKYVEFNYGDLVLVKACNLSDTENRVIKKCMAIYKGPYKVNRRTGADTY